MTPRQKDGGPAFPISVQPNFQFAEAGMTLRDWFAGKALIGLCQADMPEGEFETSPELLARTAYRMADAMIAARAVGPAPHDIASGVIG